MIYRHEPDIHVGILTSKRIEFVLFGGYRFEGNSTPVKGGFKAEIEKGKILLTRNNENYYYKNELIIEPASFDTGSFQLRDVVIGKNFHWERKENQRFTGSLKLKIENDSLIAINILPLEEYLTSVISSEMSPNSSIEFLKTHAIVSRSWLLSQIENRDKPKNDSEKGVITGDTIIKWYDREDHADYDVCADDHCQRYQGITKVISKNAREAIESTKGLILTQGSSVCDTRYSKCCGGLTESFENVWSDRKYRYLSAVADYKFDPEEFDTDFTIEENAEKWIKKKPNAFCNTTDEKILGLVLVDFDRETKDFYRWKVEYTQDELSDLLKRRTGIDFGSIIDLIPLERGYSSRIIKLQVVGSNRTVVIGKELEIRRSLSESHLYSSAFVIEKKDIKNNTPGRFILNGAGWGHGVGLCQIGAAVMSEMGYEFDEILFHYFKNSKIEKRY